MSCNCRKNVVTEIGKARQLVKKEMEIDNVDFVIYKDNGKIYHERKECWIKAGKPGKILEIYYC